MKNVEAYFLYFIFALSGFLIGVWLYDVLN